MQKEKTPTFPEIHNLQPVASEEDPVPTPVPAPLSLDDDDNDDESADNQLPDVDPQMIPQSSDVDPQIVPPSSDSDPQIVPQSSDVDPQIVPRLSDVDSLNMNTSSSNSPTLNFLRQEASGLMNGAHFSGNISINFIYKK